MTDKTLTYAIVAVVAAVFLLNPGITGNAQFTVDSSYGPSKFDNIVRSEEFGTIFIVPSLGEKSGTGKIFTDAEVCIGDKQLGTNGEGVINSLSQSEAAAIELAETACYVECLRFGGRIGSAFTRKFLDTPYRNICKRVKVECTCRI